MPENITPVGALAQGPNPQQGLSNLSSILGVAQQRQNLQTGQFRQEEAQAGAQSAQQAMSERQIMIQSLRSGKDPDGNSILSDSPDPVTGKPAPDPQKLISLAQRWMPQTGQQVQQSILTTQSNKASLADAVRGLSQNYKNDMSGIYRSYMDTNAKAKDITGAVDNYVHAQGDNPQAVMAAHWGNNLIGDHFDNMSPAAKKDALLHLSQQLQPASATSAEALPKQTTNAAGQIINVTPGTGALSPAPVAGGSGTASPPVAGLNLGLNPSAPQAAAAGAGAQGQIASDNARFGQIMDSASKGQTITSLADQVGALAEQVRTGKLTKEWADRLTVLQQHDPTLTAQQMLAKYAAQLKTYAESSAGTDAERNQIGQGLPTPETMGPDAIKEASQYMHGYGRLLQARGTNASQHVATNGTPGLTQKDTAFMQTQDPFIYTFKDMPRADQKAFLLRRFGAGDSAALQDFERRYKALP